MNKGLAVTLNVNGQTVELLPEEVEVSTKPKQGYSLAEENDVLVAVDVTITENLKKEGLARDIVRRIQNQRKEAGFNIADYIETYYEASPRLTEVFKDFGDYIASETLSKSLRNKQPPKEAHTASYKIEGEHLKIGLVRINH